MARILILANHDLGLYKFRKELIQEILYRGNEIYTSLPNGEQVKNLVDMGCVFIETEVDRRGLNPINDFRLLLFYLKIFKEIKPDFVITYTIKPNIYGGIVSNFVKIPYAINITGLGTAFQKDGFLKKVIIFLYKISSKKANVVFFENQENQQLFIDNNIVIEKNTCKLNGAGVNLDEYKYCEYPRDNGKIRFLFIGRVMKEKGIDELFEVACRIKRKYKNVIFDIVGPFEDKYEKKIMELQKMDVIKYHGFQTDVRMFIKTTNCFVLPSYHEGMANTLLESGAMGRPLITSNICGCKEAVIEGESGFLVKVGDSDDLYSKIKKFIELPYNIKVDMGMKSREHIEKEFDKKLVVKSTLEALSKKINFL
jgi:glycosyltransferase involved in cell wall biosynthesis